MAIIPYSLGSKSRANIMETMKVMIWAPLLSNNFQKKDFTT